MKEIIVFRYGHRIVRDYRVSSHCSLVARAFGAKKIVICGEEDHSMKQSVDDITNRWGGKFKVEFTQNWENYLKNVKDEGYVLVHLTMYGEILNTVEKKIRKNNKICIIIGSQKVDAKVYSLADYNISVTTQPHSEIAALAVTMDRLNQGKELSENLPFQKKRIIPQKKGKKVIDLK